MTHGQLSRTVLMPLWVGMLAFCSLCIVGCPCEDTCPGTCVDEICVCEGTYVITDHPDQVPTDDYPNFSHVEPADIVFCDEIHGSLAVLHNDDRTDMEGFNNLRSVSDTLDISNNAAMTSLQGLDSLTEVSSYLKIWDNNGLTNLEGLESLTGTDYLSVLNNEEMTDLKGLDNFVRVGIVRISGNGALRDLQGLNNLTSVSDLVIWTNSGLRTLQGVENLRTVTHHLNITGNGRLTSLRALSNVTSVGGSLEINYNGSLPTCEAEWLLYHIGIDNIGQGYCISNNYDYGTCD